MSGEREAGFVEPTDNELRKLERDLDIMAACSDADCGQRLTLAARIVSLYRTRHRAPD